MAVGRRLGNARWNEQRHAKGKNLWAGQTVYVGHVNFSRAGAIAQITLGQGWQRIPFYNAMPPPQRAGFFVLDRGLVVVTAVK